MDSVYILVGIGSTRILENKANFPAIINMLVQDTGDYFHLILEPIELPV